MRTFVDLLKSRTPPPVAEPRHRLIMFAKRPMPGAVKTRLAATVGGEVACELAEAFLRDLATAIEEVPIEKVLAYTPCGDREYFEDVMPLGWLFWEQHGGNLGKRLARLLNRSRETTTIVIGSDSPWLKADDIHLALAALEETHTAVGPCEDGGFYLLGLRAQGEAPRRKDLMALLPRIRWSTAQAMPDLLAALGLCRLNCRLLPMGYDVDTEDDLRRLAAELNQPPSEDLPATRKVMARLIPPQTPAGIVLR